MLAVALGACAGETRAPSPTETVPQTTTTVPATTTTTLSVEAATAEFRSCLIDRGVSIGDVPFDSQGRPRLELALVGVDFVDPAAVEALSDCSDMLTGGALDLSIWPQLQEQVQLALETFSDCVRTHGVVAFPEPVDPFVGVGGPYPLDEIPFDDPDLEAAVATCSARVAQSGS